MARMSSEETQKIRLHFEELMGELIGLDFFSYSDIETFQDQAERLIEVVNTLSDRCLTEVNND
jgi:hypothetical protein